LRYDTTVVGPTVLSISESACDAMDGIERYIEVARRERRNCGVTG